MTRCLFILEQKYVVQFANRFDWILSEDDISLMQIENRRRETHEPRGTPTEIQRGVVNESSNNLLIRKDRGKFIDCKETLDCTSLDRSPWHHTLSNAFFSIVFDCTTRYHSSSIQLRLINTGHSIVDLIFGVLSHTSRVR